MPGCKLGGSTSPSLPSWCRIPVRLHLELGKWRLDSVLWAQAVVASFTLSRFGFAPRKALAVATIVSPAAGSRGPRVGDPRRTGGGRQTSWDWWLLAGPWCNPVRWEESPVYQRKPRPEECRAAQGHTTRTHAVWFSSAGPGSLQRGWSGQAR